MGLALVVFISTLITAFLLFRLTLHSSTEREAFDDPMVILARSYIDEVAPFSLKDFDAAYERASSPELGRGATMLVQVINGSIWVDRSRWTSYFAWDNLRAVFVLEQIRILFKEHSLPDLEFILNTHDCPLRADLNFPIFSMTKCHARPLSLPVPQWFAWRDGAFGNWDNVMDNSFLSASQVSWQDKQDKAVFYGALRRSSLVQEGEGLAWINLEASNWDSFGRGKLWRLHKEHTDLFEVGLVRAGSIENLEEVLKAMDWRPKPYLPMDQQALNFKYAIYLEGTCGWADRLKNLLALGMLVFIQETPCQEFFHPLLQPWVHYVPIHADLSDLVERVDWARGHSELAQEIAMNAADFAKTHLSIRSWRLYMLTLLQEYAKTLAYQPERRKGTQKYVRSIICPVRIDSRCNIEECFS